MTISADVIAPSTAPATSKHSPRSRPFSLFWPALCLAAVVVVAKAASLRWVKSTTPRSWAADLTTASAADVLFVTGWAFLGAAALWPARHRPRWQIGIFVTWLALSALFACFAVVNVKVFEFLRTPLTYPLIYIANDLGNMRSSIGAFLTPKFVAWTVAAPLLFLALSWIANRYLRPPSGKWGHVARALPLLLVAWQAWFAHQTLGTWAKRPDKRLVESPHWVFLRSCADQVFGAGHSARLATWYPREFHADFATAAQRKHPHSQPATRPFAGPPPKNVILIVLESIGAQHMSLYGSPYDTTPRLKSESQHALVFDAHHAHQGMSANSLYNILTSAYTPISYLHFTLEHPDAPGTSIAQVLKARGYRTAYMTSTDTRWADFRRFLNGRGFDSISDFRDLGGNAGKISSWTVEDRVLFDHAINWVGDNSSSAPFFLMLWTGQGHHPYAVRPSEGQPLISFVKDRRDDTPSPETLNNYLNVIRQTDHHIGRLFDYLRQHGLADDTLVVVTGDHGEAFGYPHDSYGHGLQIYQETIHVPLMFWNPRAFPSGRRIGTLSGHIDLAPTILDVLGVHDLPGSWQGRSLFATGRTGRVYLFSAGYDYLLGLREGSFKYILNATTGREELYDLSTDPSELSDLAAQHADQTAIYRQRLAAWSSEHARRARQMKSEPATTQPGRRAKKRR